MNGCLHKDPAGRWPNAKSLRSALSPIDDESDDGTAVRFLRIGAATMPIALLALAYRTLFAPGHSISQPGPLQRMVVGLLMTSVLFLLGSTLRLKGAGMDARTIFGKALQQ